MKTPTSDKSAVEISSLCLEINTVLANKGLAVTMAALSELITLGISTHLEIAEEEGPRQLAHARCFVEQFLQIHISQLSKAAGAKLNITTVQRTTH